MGTRRKLNKLPEFPVFEVSLSGIKFAMFLTRSEYDRSVNTFSPEGRLFQVEYAMEPTTIEKIVEVDKHCALAFSGLTADSKMLVERARVESQNHWFVYDEPLKVESIAQAVSNLAIQFGDSDSDGGGLSRPFGVSLLFAGVDEKEGPVLFHMDPSGTYVKYEAKAIGSGSEGAMQSLQEVYHKSMTLKEAIKNSLTILKQVMEEKLNDTNAEVATITKDGFCILKANELQDYIKELS